MRGPPGLSSQIRLGRIAGWCLGQAMVELALAALVRADIVQAALM